MKESFLAYIENLSRLLRREVKSLKEKQTVVINNKTSLHHKIGQVAVLLRQKVHQLKKQKPKS
jgi:Na+-transporting methylmalonyl-CoA/oxaloacetate decarboxylase gamma subunit